MLTRRFPVAAAFPAFGDMDRLFDELISRFDGGESPAPFGAKQLPALNVWQDEQNVFVEAELPGFTMDNVNLSLTGRDLTIQAERSTQSQDEGVSYLRRERATGTFARSIRLPVNIDSENVSARLTDGVLTITLPKAAEARPRKIAVAVN